MRTKDINVLSVASDVGSVYAGKSRAPAAFESAGLQDALIPAGFKVTGSAVSLDGYGDWTSSTREPNGARNEHATVHSCRRVREAVLQALDGKPSSDAEIRFQLILAGECLYCPAILSAYWHHLHDSGKQIGIIYMDADCDLYTPEDLNSSGNIAGMTLTHLTLRDGALRSMASFAQPNGTSVANSENIVLFGLNIDSTANKRAHLGYLFDHNFRVFTSQAVQRSPAHQAMSALRWMEERVDYIFVHLDVDVIDPGVFPLGNVPNWTGLGFDEAMIAMKVFLGSDKLVGMSVAEVNPDHDPGLKMTKRLVHEITAGLAGKSESFNL